jgi:hypothetical protein
VVQALPTEGGNMVDCCCCRVGYHIIQQTSGTAGTIAAQFFVDMTSEPYAFIRRLWMLVGHTLFRFPVFNIALRRHSLCDEGSTFHNKRGRLPVDTEHSDTPPVLRGPRK